MNFSYKNIEFCICFFIFFGWMFMEVYFEISQNGGLNGDDGKEDSEQESKVGFNELRFYQTEILMVGRTLQDSLSGIRMLV